jgi:hypothetical protein
MTKTEFITAKRSFNRQISWLVMLWFVLWLVTFFAIGAGFRYWFHEHETISTLVLAAGVLIFIVPVFFISRFLHRKHKLVCPSCGGWLLIETAGRCSKCQSEIFYDA